MAEEPAPVKPKRRGPGRTGSPSQGNAIALLSLTKGYLDNPEAFARPGPPPPPPVKVKFTCKACGYQVVDPYLSRCEECRAPLWAADH